MGRSSPLARPVDLDPARNATERQVAARFLAPYPTALPRLPIGSQEFHGLPFDLGPASAGRRWVLVDKPVTIELDGGVASHVVVAHLCDTWRDDDGRRPDGLAVGHVVPAGEPLARYTVVERSGRTTDRVVRRRFEIADGILGWGMIAFAAIPHVAHEVVDWRGPHPVQGPGRYAPAGHSGTLTIMPGSYMTSQTGVSDFVPSPTDDALLWLHAIELEAGAEPVALRLEPLGEGRPGSDVIVAGVTLFRGSSNPLVRGPRFQVRVDGLAGHPLEVDLGTVIRTRAAPTSAPPDGTPDGIVGWGAPRQDQAGAPAPGAVVVDLAIAPDAMVDLGGWSVSGRELQAGVPLRDPAGRRSIEALPPPRVSVEVEIVDGTTGEQIPGRIRFIAADGRYLPPVGHRDEVNPGNYEDTGADLVLGSATYAYVPGRFAIELPVGEVDVELVGGFDRAVHRARLEIDPSTRRLKLPLDRTIDLHAGRWVTADTHVHFISPSTALLQAAAEDVDLVNLLATQWGDLFTNVTDLPWGSMADPSGRRIVVVGTENRQNVLGHLALLGAHRPVHPLASGGPPEGRMAGALSVLLADWADRCRAAGGLVVAAHFPLPYAEVAADIVSGKIDAIETQALAPRLDDPSILEWYRFLNLGYRLPIVAGTDKMSAEIPVGAVRAYVHLLTDEALTFDAWAAAVRAGRTFVTSGPILELTVEGHEPGDVIRLRSGGRLEIALRARAAQPVITDLELLVNGRVVAAAGPTVGSTELTLHETVEIAAGAWIAARSRSGSEIHSAFATSMAAHTSPVYVEVEDRPLVGSTDDADTVEQIIAGARAWVAELAAIADPGERERMVRFFDVSLETFRRRMR